MKISAKLIYRVTMCMLLLSLVAIVYRYFHKDEEPMLAIFINAVTPVCVLTFLLVSFVKYNKDRRLMKRKSADKIGTNN